MIDWYVETDHRRARAGAARGAIRGRMSQERTHPIGIVIISALFFVLLSAAVMIGGHAAIGPLLRFAVGSPHSGDASEVLVTMPDGMFCRHMSFDNVTGETIEGGLQRCPGRIGDREAGPSRFSWGGR